MHNIHETNETINILGAIQFLEACILYIYFY